VFPISVATWNFLFICSKSIDNQVLQLKKLIKGYEIRQNGRRIQNGLKSTLMKIKDEIIPVLVSALNLLDFLSKRFH
jgi:hypothetical protein